MLNIEKAPPSEEMGQTAFFGTKVKS